MSAPLNHRVMTIKSTDLGADPTASRIGLMSDRQRLTDRSARVMSHPQHLDVTAALDADVAHWAQVERDNAEMPLEVWSEYAAARARLDWDDDDDRRAFARWAGGGR